MTTVEHDGDIPEDLNLQRRPWDHEMSHRTASWGLAPSDWPNRPGFMTWWHQHSHLPKRFATKPLWWKTSNVARNICFNVIFRLPCIPDNHFFQVSRWCSSGIWRRTVWYTCTDLSDQPAAFSFSHFLSHFYPEYGGNRSPPKRLTHCTKIDGVILKYHSCHTKRYGNAKSQYFQVKNS